MDILFILVSAWYMLCTQTHTQARTYACVGWGAAVAMRLAFYGYEYDMFPS